MDARPDTSSGRSHDGWSFLHLGASRDAQARSLPPSSYVRSDRSSISPLRSSHHTYNGSRSSLSRHLPSVSSGARSTATTPSQPVLLRINSAHAGQHNNPSEMRSQRPMETDPETGMPALEEFTLRGILSAIYEDIEHDLNIISETLGRHNFVLADQHERQMPPQGEITAWTVGVGNADMVDEELGDNVMIVREDASLIDGSNSSSAAYGLLERLQTVPRPIRTNSDVAGSRYPGRAVPVSPNRTRSSPAVVHEEPEPSTAEPAVTDTDQQERSAHPVGRGPSRAVVSETYLAAEGNGVISGIVPMVSEAGRQYPLYTHDNAEVFETSASTLTSPSTSLGQRSNTGRTFEAIVVPNYFNLASLLSRSNRSSDRDAEARLRALLRR